MGGLGIGRLRLGVILCGYGAAGLFYVSCLSAGNALREREVCADERSMRQKQIWRYMMKRLILATASAVALAIAGTGPIYAASNTMPSATPPATSPTATSPTGQAATDQSSTGAAQSPMPQTGANQPVTPSPYANANPGQPNMATAPVSRSEVRQAQQQLRQDHLYRGRIDGIVGSETRQALQRYQRKNGLPVTAQLDQDTMNSLIGNGQGSSAPPETGAMAPANGAGSPGAAMPNAGANPPSPGATTPNTGR